jgi:hypothetical protein
LEHVEAFSRSVSTVSFPSSRVLMPKADPTGYGRRQLDAPANSKCATFLFETLARHSEAADVDRW